MNEVIIWSVAFFVGNVLDLVTTYSVNGNLPLSKLHTVELNPLGKLIIHNKKLTVAVKMGVTVVALSLFIRAYIEDGEYALVVLKAMTLVMLFVVVNNIHSNWAKKNNRLSIGKYIKARFKLPDGAVFIIIITFLLFISFSIAINL